MRVEKCPVCNGRGWMPDEFYSNFGSTTSTARVICRTCGGSGIVYVPD